MKKLVFVMFVLVLILSACNNRGLSNPTIYNLICYQQGQVILDEIVTPDLAKIHAYYYPGGEFLQVPYGDTVECVWNLYKNY
jgi:hypothetical protein